MSIAHHNTGIGYPSAQANAKVRASRTRVDIFKHPDGTLEFRALIGSLCYWPGALVQIDHPDYAAWNMFYLSCREQNEFLTEDKR